MDAFSCYVHCTPPHVLSHTNHTAPFFLFLHAASTYTAHLLFCSPFCQHSTSPLLLPHATYTAHLPFCSPCYLHYTSICSFKLPTFCSAPSCYLTLNTSPCAVHTAYTECLSSHYSMLHTLHISLHPYCLGHTAQFYSHLLPTL